MKKPTDEEVLVIQGTDPRYITKEQIGWLSQEQIGELSRWQIGWLSQEQIGWLSRWQIGGLSRWQIGGLSQSGLAVLDEAKNAPILEKPYTKLLAVISNGEGKLEMANWHSCKTTHCVGGWLCELTPGGKELEKKWDTQLAATFILRNSRPDAPLPNFTASNEAAMAFIRARAKEEA